MGPLHFLFTQCLHPLHWMLLLPSPVRQTARGNLLELCSRLKPVSHIMILVFPVFTFSPFLSIPSVQVSSLRTHFFQGVCNNDKGNCIKDPAKVLRLETPVTKPQARRWRALDWAQSPDVHRPSPQTRHYTITNPNTAPHNLMHSLNKVHNPFLNTKLSHCPPDHFPRNSVERLLLQVHESHNQRTNGPVNAHLISWPCKAQNIKNLENIW